MPLRIVHYLQPVRRKTGYAVAAGLIIFLGGFELRYAFGSMLESVPFITLFPAILIAALVGGLMVGLMVAVLSFFAGWYFFLPPLESWAVDDARTVWALVFFWVTAGIQLYVIHALNQAVDSLSVERDRVGVLFRELQHRVANNLTFVASLLRQERKRIAASPEQGAAILDEAQSRIDTMARVHRRLFDPAILDLPLTSYLEALARDILTAANARNIVCVVETVPVRLELTRLVTLSLLINELITNSLKHGFAGREDGTISVKLDRQAEQLLLTIRDDGKGLDRDIAAEGSLGMTIIRSLAGQLGGQITWSSGAGTTVHLRFPA